MKSFYSTDEKYTWRARTDCTDTVTVSVLHLQFSDDQQQVV